jgi:hypothetical protein
VSSTVTDHPEHEPTSRPSFGSVAPQGIADDPEEAVLTGAGRRVTPPATPIARMLVHAAGLPLALRLAPRILLEVPGVTTAGSGPGWVRLRCVMNGAPETRRRCLERQAKLLALPARLRLPPLVLEEAACAAGGDAACEYVLHGRQSPRWALVGLAAGCGLVIGLLAGAPFTATILLGVLGLAVAAAAEQWRARRTDVATRAASSRAFRWLVRQARVPSSRSPLEASGPAPEPGRAPEAEVIFEQEGDVWRATYAEVTIRIRHSRGLALLSHLVRHPGEELHVQVLDGLVPSAGASSDHPPLNTDTLPRDGMSFSLGDAGPVLDDRARAEYRHRLAEVHAEVDDAERCNDPGRAASARAEIEALSDELRAAAGLGGRVRRASSDIDRIRVAVTRRIRAAIEQLGKLHPALGAHLEQSVRTGFTCCYSPVGSPDRSR